MKSARKRSCISDCAVARVRRQEKQDVQTYFQTIKQQLSEQATVHIISSIATSLDTDETLISIAETGEEDGLLRIMEICDIIALATHGRSGPTRWMMGSITERILGATRLPLLMVRPQHTDEPQVSQENKAQAPHLTLITRRDEKDIP